MVGNSEITAFSYYCNFFNCRHILAEWATASDSKGLLIREISVANPAPDIFRSRTVRQPAWESNRPAVGSASSSKSCGTCAQKPLFSPCRCSLHLPNISIPLAGLFCCFVLYRKPHGCEDLWLYHTVLPQERSIKSARDVPEQRGQESPASPSPCSHRWSQHQSRDVSQPLLHLPTVCRMKVEIQICLLPQAICITFWRLYWK